MSESRIWMVETGALKRLDAPIKNALCVVEAARLQRAEEALREVKAELAHGRTANMEHIERVLVAALAGEDDGDLTADEIRDMK